MLNFKDYFESEIRFGKHIGKEISTINTGYLAWVMQNVAVGNRAGTISAEQRAEIDEFLKSKNINWQTFNLNSPKTTPTQATQAPRLPDREKLEPGTGRINIPKDNFGAGEPVNQVQATKTASTDIWHYVKSVKDCRHFQKDKYLAIKGPLSNGSWAFRVLDNDPNKAKAGVITKDEIKDLIVAYRDKTNTTLRPTNPNNPNIEDLKKQLNQLGQPETEEQPEEQPEIEPGRNETGKPLPQDVKIPPEKMTIFNKKIEEKFLTSDKGIMIDALAGTGKTTVLKHLSSFVKPGERWLYLVFGKRNQVESSTKFPSGIDILTTHAFLGQLLKKNGKSVGGETTLPPKDVKWKKIGLVLDKMVNLSWPKSRKNFTNRKGEEQSPFNYKAKSIVIKAASLAKNTAHDPNDPKIKEQLKTLINKFAIETDLSTERTIQDRDYTPDMIEKVIELMKLTMPGGLTRNLGIQELANVRDQDDTLWYTALHSGEMNWSMGYKVVLMDEVQDFNKCQLIMAKKLKEAGARVVGVGDKNQSMYLFRGSDSDAFEEFKNIIGDERPSELPINFRSGGNLIDWVNKNTVVTNLQSPEHLKGKGEVYANGGTHPPIGYNDFMTQMNDEWQKYPENGKKLFKEETCIISRTNAPLAHAALQLLKNNINFEIIGKDLSRDLIRHIKTVTWNKPEQVEIDDLPHKLGDFFGQLKEKWGDKISKEDELKEMEEYTDTLNSVLQYLYEKEYKETPESRPIETAKDFMDFIVRKMGGKDPDSVEDMKQLKAKDPLTFITLTTAHKCKGFEWDRTFLMKPKDYNPENPKNKTDEQKDQERNTFYVASTRAAKSMYISSDDEP